MRTLRAKLFFILLSLKGSPTFDVAGILFEVERSRACRWVGQWRPLLEAVRGRAAVLPARQSRSVAECLQRFPAVQDLFLDGTERPTQRPQQPARQRARYSGKKKRHTGKNVIGNAATKRIVLLGRPRAGGGRTTPCCRRAGGCPSCPRACGCGWIAAAKGASRPPLS